MRMMIKPEYMKQKDTPSSYELYFVIIVKNYIQILEEKNIMEKWTLGKQ